jgi:regulator of protease activity HflC (stomatin/prohibitin superfamily)
MIIAIVVVLVFLSLRVVKEYDRGVIFFLGKYTGVRGPGLIILIPVLEQMARVTLRTITMNIPSQKIITKDTSRSTLQRWRTTTSSTRRNR